MIGLRRHVVSVVEHDPAWAALFAEEAEVIRRAAGPLAREVEHVGSTAVPGLVAKPVLDIGVAVRAAGDIDEVVRRLVGAGYLDLGDQGREGGYLLARESEPDVRTVHLHIVTSEDEQWSGYLSFRNALRHDARLREEYAALKSALVAQYPQDREQYTQGKQGFIRRVLSPDVPRGSAGAPENSDDLGFTYQVRKSGAIEIFHHGRSAATLRGRAASEFLNELRGDSAAGQQAMARLTGNYKRGNERLAREHPRNQGERT
jgi:GrpB-like predicted nucleotidyltransferase (UPF0157 family)